MARRLPAHVEMEINIRDAAMLDKKVIYWILSIIIIMAGLINACSNNNLLLPGQTDYASSLLMNTVSETEKTIGKPIEFLDINNHPDKTVSSGSVEGTFSLEGPKVRIWLEPSLSSSEIEAVVAHELGHIVQALEGWASTGSLRNVNDQPLFPQISFLGSYIGSLVSDPNANEWAKDHGFSVEKYFQSHVLPNFLSHYFNDFKADEYQANDWNKFYDALDGLSGNASEHINGTKQIVIQDPEFITIGFAVTYAHLMLSYGNYDSFSEIDELFEEKAPLSRSLGLEIVMIVENTGYDSKEQNEEALISVLEYLNIPTSLLWVRQPSTAEIVWPR